MTEVPKDQEVPAEGMSDDELEDVSGGVDQFGGGVTRGIAPNAMGKPVVPGANA